MVRQVLIVVTAVFAPLAFAGSLADITVAWTRRWVETTVALIVAKLILVLIFVVGLGLLVDGVGQAGRGPPRPSAGCWFWRWLASPPGWRSKSCTSSATNPTIYTSWPRPHHRGGPGVLGRPE